MHDNPKATEHEQEQGPQRIEDEEEMRGPNESDPEPPAQPGDDGDDT